MQKGCGKRPAILILWLPILILIGQQQAAAQARNSTAPGWWSPTQILKGLEPGRQSGLEDGQIGAGLKEALQIGTQNAVALAGRSNGYFNNPALKILMPQQLQTLEATMRMAGYGPQVDAFVLSMNQAAERAAPAAAQIFTDALSAMTFEDVRSILAGGDTAATDYFKAKTSNQLVAAFRPIVEQTMNEVGAVRRYKELFTPYQSIPFMTNAAFDIDQYVVSKGLDGLFHILSEEERKIRTDPTARVTDLLKEVFAK
jgi:hypothetical protein